MSAIKQYRTNLTGRSNLKPIIANALRDGATYEALAKYLNQQLIAPCSGHFWTTDAAYNAARHFKLRSNKRHDHSAAAITQRRNSVKRVKCAIIAGLKRGDINGPLIIAGTVAPLARKLGLSSYLIATHRRQAIREILADASLPSKGVH